MYTDMCVSCICVFICVGPGGVFLIGWHVNTQTALPGQPFMSMTWRRSIYLLAFIIIMLLLVLQVLSSLSSLLSGKHCDNCTVNITLWHTVEDTIRNHHRTISIYLSIYPPIYPPIYCISRNSIQINSPGVSFIRMTNKFTYSTKYNDTQCKQIQI